jgi:hypothetical protein
MKNQLALIALLIPTLVFAQSAPISPSQSTQLSKDRSYQTPFDAQAEGERLEKTWWDQQQNQDISGLTKLMSPAFQSINSKGVQDLAFNMKVIKTEKLRNYQITNIKVTQSQDNLVITYQFSASENYLGKKMSPKFHNRLDVWTKSAEGWQIIAHANLDPV